MIGTKTSPGEIIIINDSSDDDTPEQIEILMGRYSNVKSLRTNSNSGAAAARLIGLNAASYEYSGFLDGDDWVSTDAFSLAYQKISETDAELCVIPMERVNDAGECIYKFTLDLGENQVISGKEAAHKSLLNWGIYANGLCKTENWIAAYRGITNMMFDSDELISRNLLLISKNVTSCGGKYYYRMNVRSSTETKQKSIFQEIEKMNWIINFGLKNSFTSEDPKLAVTHLSLVLSTSISFLITPSGVLRKFDVAKQIREFKFQLAVLSNHCRFTDLLRPKILLASLLVTLGFSSKIIRRLLVFFSKMFR